MKTFAQAAAEAKQALWTGAIAESRDQFLKKRTYKVGLCVMICSEIEVEAESPIDAQRLGEQQVDKATVTMHTTPYATRLMVQRRTDPKNPESPLEWVEIVYGPIDAFDGNSPAIWHVKA